MMPQCSIDGATDRLHPTASILIPSYKRLGHLTRCLESLAKQSHVPDEIIVVWQGQDSETLEHAHRMAAVHGLPIRTIHASQPGITTAENAGLAGSRGEVVLMIDDDAVAPTGWVEAHLAHYIDPRIGAVGGAYYNHDTTGIAYKLRTPKRIGHISWYGRFIGNCHDLDPSVRLRGPMLVDHVAGGNMSFRKAALHSFCADLRPYWQLFEAEACLRIQANGYLILFDPHLFVDHYPLSPFHDCRSRGGDQQYKLFNLAYNHSYILSEYSTGWRRVARFLYCHFIGTTATPGPLLAWRSMWTYGNYLTECQIILKVLKARISGWRDGANAKIVYDMRTNEGTCRRSGARII